MMGNMHSPEQAYHMVYIMFQPEEQVFAKEQHYPVDNGVPVYGQVILRQPLQEGEGDKEAQQPVDTGIEQVEVHIHQGLPPAVKMQPAEVAHQHLQRYDDRIDGDGKPQQYLIMELIHGAIYSVVFKVIAQKCTHFWATIKAYL